MQIMVLNPTNVLGKENFTVRLSKDVSYNMKRASKTFLPFVVYLSTSHAKNCITGRKLVY